MVTMGKNRRALDLEMDRNKFYDLMIVFPKPCRAHAAGFGFKQLFLRWNQTDQKADPRSTHPDHLPRTQRWQSQIF